MVVAALCFFDQAGRNVHARKGCVLHICKEQQSELGRIAVVLDGPHHRVHANDVPDSNVYTAVLPEAPFWLKLPCTVIGENVAFTHVCVDVVGSNRIRLATAVSDNQTDRETA